MRTASVILAVLFLVITCGSSMGLETQPGDGSCAVCGMKVTDTSRSRARIVYTDGKQEEFCNFRCALVQMQRYPERKRESLLVADHATGSLIDAASATWVVGGEAPGPMGSTANRAFAREEEAREFAREHGGDVMPFDAAVERLAVKVDGEGGHPHDHHSHSGHGMDHMDHMGNGAQMIYNPGFADDIYHTHPAGMWMTTFKYMHMKMKGLRDGTTNIPVSAVVPMTGTTYRYMMAPTEMTMDMQMLMVMYGVTDRFTLMGMANYQRNKMDMVMNMGMGGGNKAEPPMTASGIGDTELRGIFKISESFTGSLGLGIPTGDITQEFQTMGQTFRMPYDMQLGSGTVDLKPSLTFSQVSGDGAWNWGGQATYTYHIDRNGEGYSLGDSFKATSWLQRALGPASGWLRLAYTDTQRIRGRDAAIQKLLTMTGAPTPDADPRNYGGQRLDGLFGASIVKGPLSFGVELGYPLYQYLNGLQMKAEWQLNLGLQAMF
jgi:nitrous oxide reductase accessory protein NosL